MPIRFENSNSSDSGSYTPVTPVTQGLVQVNDSDTPGYLIEKIDGVTVHIDGDKMIIKSVDGLEIGITEINTWLSGTSGNIQSQINEIQSILSTLSTGMEFLGKVETHADMTGIGSPDNGDLVVVLTDETKDNGRTLYIYSDTLGTWVFIGEFEFSDKFISLKDTPNTYTGQDGKVLKVDGINEQLVFDTVKWSDVEGKPDVLAIDIENAANNSHIHTNKDDIDRLSISDGKVAVDGVVPETHTHANKSDLDKIGTNTYGNLTVNGVEYRPYVEKQWLNARNTVNKTIGRGYVFTFDEVQGNIEYSNGLFLLRKDKVYQITFTYHLLTSSVVRVHLINHGTDTMLAGSTWSQVFSATYAAKKPGLPILNQIIAPTTDTWVKIRTNRTLGDTGATLYGGHGGLTVHEL